MKGSKGSGTVTDIDGVYSIDVTNRTELEFTYIGYTKQTLTVGDLGVLDVKM